MENSYDKSSTSSVLLLPPLVINPHILSTLSDLPAKMPAGPLKINILVAILEIEGPNRVTVTKGIDKGKEVSVLKMLVSDESSSICKLTAWRDVADAWGREHASQVTRPRRGDTVYVESAFYLNCLPRMHSTDAHDHAPQISIMLAASA